MSEILNLAKGFEEKSKQQAQDTEQSVKREFVRLETSISAELQSSSQSISNAIREQNGRLTGMLRKSVSTAMAWIFFCFALLIGIMGGIIWFQGTIITSRLSEMDSYSQQLANLKAKSGAGVTIYSDDTRRNTYLVVLPKQAHGVETYRFSIGSAPLTSITKSDAQISGGETRQDLKIPGVSPWWLPRALSCSCLSVYRCHSAVMAAFISFHA
ncbi:MbeB family mobilization protein [Enterobacter hormaechei]|nr:MbeB family mobilization protein [Enterobacter hormaechei]